MTFEPEFSYLPPRMTEICQCKDDPAKMMFCSTGHMTECHFPLRCDGAGCGHLERYDYAPEIVAELRKTNHAIILSFADESCKICEGTGIRAVKMELGELFGVPELTPGIQVSEYRTLCLCVALNLIKATHPNSPIVTESAFNIGRLFITSGAKAKWQARGDNWESEASVLVARHWRKDWGDMDAEDHAENDAALQDGGRLLSRYEVTPDFTIWIVTEADRSTTTVLLADEY